MTAMARKMTEDDHDGRERRDIVSGEVVHGERVISLAL